MIACSLLVVLWPFCVNAGERNDPRSSHKIREETDNSNNLEIVASRITGSKDINNSVFPEEKLGIYGIWDCKGTKTKRCTTDDGFNGTVIGPVTAEGIRVRIITYGYHVSYVFDSIAEWNGSRLTASASEFPENPPCTIDFTFGNNYVENKPRDVERCFIYGWLGNKDKLIKHSLIGAE